MLKGDKAGEWWKFTINIISVYKQGGHRIRRGDQLLWVRAKDVACKCPKIKPGRKYLLMGSDDDDSRGQSGVVADRAACSSRGRTCGPVGSGNSSSVTRGASAREKHGGKTERSGEKERKRMTRATSEQID